jgi:hypothetical protein
MKKHKGCESNQVFFTFESIEQKVIVLQRSASPYKEGRGAANPVSTQARPEAADACCPIAGIAQTRSGTKAHASINKRLNASNHHSLDSAPKE